VAFLKIYCVRVFTVSVSVYEINGSIGAYHVGIDVCGLEWSYGGIDDGTGVFYVQPHEASIGKFKESIKVGETSKSVDEILDCLKRLSTTWRGSEYNLLGKNCLIFSQAFLSEICPGKELPKWTTATANSLKALAPLIAESKTGAISTSITSVINDRMWIDARIRMIEFEKVTRKKQSGSIDATHARILHSESTIQDHDIHQTVDYVHRVERAVTMRYSRYSKSLLRCMRFPFFINTNP